MWKQTKAILCVSLIRFVCVFCLKKQNPFVVLQTIIFWSEGCQTLGIKTDNRKKWLVAYLTSAILSCFSPGWGWVPKLHASIANPPCNRLPSVSIKILSKSFDHTAALTCPCSFLVPSNFSIVLGITESNSNVLSFLAIEEDKPITACFRRR